MTFKGRTGLVSSIFTLAFVLGSSATASAGSRYMAEVYVTQGSYGYGHVSAAYASSDSRQYIGCTLYRSASYEYVYCSAQNATGAFANCFSDNPKIAQTAQAITPFSAIQFSNKNGTCEYLQVSNYSESSAIHSN